MSNTAERGSVTEAQVLAAFIRAGVPVCLPWGGHARYDFVIDCGDFLRVQVKTGRERQPGVIAFEAESRGWRASKQKNQRLSYRGDADIFAVWCPLHPEHVYILDVDTATTSPYFRIAPCLNGQQQGVRWAKDHTLTRWLAERTAALQRSA